MMMINDHEHDHGHDRDGDGWLLNVPKKYLQVSGFSWGWLMI